MDFKTKVSKMQAQGLRDYVVALTLHVHDLTVVVDIALDALNHAGELAHEAHPGSFAECSSPVCASIHQTALDLNGQPFRDFQASQIGMLEAYARMAPIGKGATA